jgi:hypothetical protein
VVADLVLVSTLLLKTLVLVCEPLCRKGSTRFEFCTVTYLRVIENLLQHNDFDIYYLEIHLIQSVELQSDERIVHFVKL